MRRALSSVAVGFLAAALPLCAAGRTNLSQHARLSFEEAQHIAQATEPGVIQTHLFHKEDGRVVYSFIVRTPHHTLRRVDVDGDTGKVLVDSATSGAAENLQWRAEAKAEDHDPGGPPVAVTRTGELAENIYDAVSANRWSTAAAELKSLQENAARVNVPADQADVNNLKPAVASLDRCIAQRNRQSAMREANRIALMATNLSDPFHPKAPTDLERLDYYGRQLEIEAAAGNLAALQSTASAIRNTWVQVRPQVESHNGSAAAALFETGLSRIEAARTPRQYAAAARDELNQVDDLERVFSR